MATPAERAMWFPEKFRTYRQTWHFVVRRGKALAAYPTRQRAQAYRDIYFPYDRDVRVIEREIRFNGSLDADHG